MREVDIKVFARSLTRIMAETGVSQSELARRTDITQQTVCDYCHGNAWPSYNRLVRIARALRVSLFDLLGYSAAEILNELSLRRPK